jgi:CPA1 family monovalent cation:H+ antiporter
MALLEPIREFNWREISIMTWGGMRGGLAIALALSLPEGPEKNAVLSLTYTVVVLSILLQGLTLQPMICSLFPTKEKPVSSSDKQQQADS